MTGSRVTTTGRARRFALILVKVIGSVGLAMLALRNVDIAVVTAQLRTADAALVIAAWLVSLGISAAQAARWRIVLARLGFQMRFPKAWRVVLIGYCLDQALPSTIGGDAFKSWSAYRHGVTVGAALASVIVDRFMSLASLLLMILAGVPWLFDLVVSPTARIGIIALALGGVLGMALGFVAGRYSSLLERWRVTRWLIPVLDAFHGVFSDAAATIRVVVLTVVVLTASSFVVYLLAHALAINIGFGDTLLLVPTVALVMALPISIAGWGLRESSMVVAMGLVGVPATAAFSLSVLCGLVALASALPGAVIWLTTRQADKPADGMPAS